MTCLLAPAPKLLHKRLPRQPQYVSPAAPGIMQEAAPAATSIRVSSGTCFKFRETPLKPSQAYSIRFAFAFTLALAVYLHSTNATMPLHGCAIELHDCSLSGNCVAIPM